MLSSGTCSCPLPPSNGFTSSCSKTANNGTEINYYCNYGYILTSGDSQRMCLLGGNWTGREPLCEKGMVLAQ